MIARNLLIASGGLDGFSSVCLGVMFIVEEQSENGAVYTMGLDRLLGLRAVLRRTSYLAREIDAQHHLMAAFYYRMRKWKFVMQQNGSSCM